MPYYLLQVSHTFLYKFQQGFFCSWLVGQGCILPLCRLVQPMLGSRCTHIDWCEWKVSLGKSLLDQDRRRRLLVLRQSFWKESLLLFGQRLAHVLLVAPLEVLLGFDWLYFVDSAKCNLWKYCIGVMLANMSVNILNELPVGILRWCGNLSTVLAMCEELVAGQNTL